MLLKFYIRDERLDAKIDPLLSPIVMPDEILKLMPKIQMICGEYDGLKDECIRFLHRLYKINRKNDQLVIYRHFSHGFLNFNNYFAMPIVRQSVIDSAMMIKDLFENIKNRGSSNEQYNNKNFN